MAQKVWLMYELHVFEVEGGFSMSEVSAREAKSQRYVSTWLEEELQLFTLIEQSHFQYKLCHPHPPKLIFDL